jgi:hypothetical protein
VDETAFLAATPTSGTVFATGVVVLNGRARLLDVVEGRSGKALCDWVSGRDQSWRDGSAVAALDPFRSYATALRTTLPHAARVLDAFHVVRLLIADLLDSDQYVCASSAGLPAQGPWAGQVPLQRAPADHLIAAIQGSRSSAETCAGVTAWK